MDRFTQSFEGTPIECEAWLRQRLEYMRLLVAHQPEDGGTDYGDVYERSVWRAELTGTDLVARDRARTQLLVECDKIDAERQLFDALVPKE